MGATASSVKQMGQMLGIGGEGKGSSERDEKLPDGEKYFGFVNVSFKSSFTQIRIMFKC